MSYDPDAQSYFTAVESVSGLDLRSIQPWLTPDYIKFWINDLVISLKSTGCWDAINTAVLLRCAQSLTGALVPLKGTAPTNANFVEGDYNGQTGLKGNASTKRLNTNVGNGSFTQNDFILLPFSLNTVINPTDDLSVSGWFAGSKFLSFVRLQSTNFNYFVLGWGGITGLRVISSVDGGTAGVPIPETLVDGNWHHIAVVRQRNALLTVYLDGVNIGSRAATNTQIDIGSTYESCLGCLNKTGEFMAGRQDDIRVYTRTLQLSEIISLGSKRGYIPPMYEVRGKRKIR